MAQAGGIVVVGSINADLTARVARHPSPGETLIGSGGEITPGGKGANQALAAALQGAAVSFVGAVGDDPQAEAATALLREGGVDLSRVATVSGPTGLAIITVDDAGENSIIVVPGANADVYEALVDKHRAAIEEAAVVLLQGEIPPAASAAAARAARGRVVLNLAPVVELDAETVRAADPLVVNEHEAALAAGILGGEAPEGEPEPEELAGRLVALGVASVVVTLGPRGALVAEGDDLSHVASPSVEVRDTTGAGDAFTGALAARLEKGEGLLDAAAHACRVGAFATTRPGAQPSYPGPGEELPAVADAGPAA
ncbi:ribokinase [Corynebacterium otitidis]|uniref:Ribokinase n=1 Tax=Corynebacterium otitidis ATCC 51513 TaxID=883169 RepID=I7JVH6_9CORY|nr:ribokinase [Corynebacterium otitidis]EJZ82592.1 ribokinase [Corynebacterium otitidis ATCC 51513]CCI82851.1 ribokinase [Corynebacterium otitidis ATCC 51513]